MGKEVTLYNVAGAYRLPPVMQRRIWVVGAHYDHLGVPRARRDIYNGADDNASGTAAVIELAEAYAQVPERERELIFVVFCRRARFVRPKGLCRAD